MPLRNACYRGHNLSRCTVATLKSVTLDKRRLNGVQFAPICETLNARDFLSLGHHRQSKARQNSSSVEVDSTRTALTLVASLLRPRQLQPVPECIQQGNTGIDVETLRPPVHLQTDFCPPLTVTRFRRMALRNFFLNRRRRPSAPSAAAAAQPSNPLILPPGAPKSRASRSPYRFHFLSENRKAIPPHSRNFAAYKYYVKSPKILGPPALSDTTNRRTS